MIRTKENKRIAKTPMRTTKGLRGARKPVSGTLNNAKPAIIQARYKKGLRSNTLMAHSPFLGLFHGIQGRSNLFTRIINQGELTMFLELYSCWVSYIYLINVPDIHSENFSFSSNCG